MSNDYRQIDESREPNLHNCTMCGVVIEYAFLTTGEVLCENCYLKAVEKRSDELKNRIKEVGNIDFTIRSEQ